MTRSTLPVGFKGISGRATTTSGALYPTRACVADHLRAAGTASPLDPEASRPADGKLLPRLVSNKAAGWLWTTRPKLRKQGGTPLGLPVPLQVKKRIEAPLRRSAW